MAEIGENVGTAESLYVSETTTVDVKNTYPL